MATDPTNPVEGDDTSLEDTAADDAGVEQQEETEAETLFDDDGNPIEPEPEEDEELDFDDFKLKVPKAQAEKVRLAMLRQADYTKKTQEAAELRKALEADRNNLQQTSDAELLAAAQITSMSQQLAPFERMTQADWDRWEAEDPFAAAAGFRQYQMAIQQRGNALGQLQHMRNERLSAAQQETAKRIEEGRAALTRDIPGYNDDHKAKLMGFAAEYGFSREELDDLEADPRQVKILQAAFEGRELSRKAKAVTKHATAQAVQPAAKVGGQTAIPPAKLDDRLSADEWMRRRNAAVRKRT